MGFGRELSHPIIRIYCMNKPVLGLVLGGAMERALRQSLMMSEGSLSILVTRPISAAMLSLALLILLVPLFNKANAWRLRALEQKDA